MKSGAMDVIRRRAGSLAALIGVGSALAFGAALDGYSHAQHPLALLGARGVPHALAFNVAGFLPGDTHTDLQVDTRFGDAS